MPIGDLNLHPARVGLNVGFIFLLVVSGLALIDGLAVEAVMLSAAAVACRALAMRF